MCRTQNTLENIERLIVDAITADDMGLVEKLKISYIRKRAKMVKPTAILNIQGDLINEWVVTKVFNESFGKVTFAAKRSDGKELEFDETSVLKFIKDATWKNPNAKKKIRDVYTSLKILTLEDFIKECSEMPKVSQRKRQWLSLIRANKLTCPVTDLKVAYCSYDRSEMGSFHYNFYSEEGKLFTIDHIIPKSKGGSKMKLKNLQPMIGRYNWRKGSIDNKEYLARHGK